MTDSFEPSNGSGAVPDLVAQHFRRAWRDAALAPASSMQTLLGLLGDRQDRWRQQGAIAFVSPDALAVRSAVAADERQLFFTGPWADLVVDVVPSDGSLDLTGQVLGIDRPVAIQLLLDGIDVALTTTDTNGEFSFAEVAARTYELVVSSESGEFTVEFDLSDE